jgi:hypothetical protein
LAKGADVALCLGLKGIIVNPLTADVEHLRPQGPAMRPQQVVPSILVSLMIKENIIHATVAIAIEVEV